MAITIYLQSVHNPEQISAFFMAEGELVNEIVALVEADKAVPETIRTLALKAIAVQVMLLSIISANLLHLNWQSQDCQSLRSHWKRTPMRQGKMSAAKSPASSAKEAGDTS